MKISNDISTGKDTVMNARSSLVPACPPPPPNRSSKRLYNSRTVAQPLHALRALIAAFALASVLASCGDTTASDAKAITSFSIGTAVGVITERTITVTMPYGTDITNLSPVIRFTGRAVNPASEAPQDFTNPATYRVTADDGSVREYVVTVQLSHITSFSISAAETGLAGDLTGSIDENTATITLASQAWIENIAGLKASFEAIGAVTVNGVEQESGVTAQDFRYDIVYAVTTEDNAAREYTVVFESPQATGLPVVKIDTQHGAAIDSKETYVYANISIIDPNNATNNVELTGYKDRIRGRGNATWTYPKKPYKIKLDKKTNMLGMGNDKDWVLLANYCDKTLLRTAIAFKLSEALGFPWTPKARFVELFLNGEYMGNYQLVEGIKQGNNRIDIPETGYIVERDGYYLSEPKYFVTNGNYGYSFKNPDTDDLTDSQWNYIKNYLNEFESVLDSASFNDPVNGYSKYIETESFARWFLFHNILANMDTNPFLVKADDTYGTRLLMGPVWDFEWSLGIGWYEGERPRPANYWVQNGWYFAKLLTDDIFTEKLRELWNQNKSLVKQELLQFIDGAKDEIMKSQAVNFRRWDILNDRVSVGGIPLGSFEAEAACDRQFFINHMDWLDTVIDDL